MKLLNDLTVRYVHNSDQDYGYALQNELPLEARRSIMVESKYHKELLDQYPDGTKLDDLRNKCFVNAYKIMSKGVDIVFCYLKLSSHQRCVPHAINAIGNEYVDVTPNFSPKMTYFPYVRINWAEYHEFYTEKISGRETISGGEAWPMAFLASGEIVIHT